MALLMSNELWHELLKTYSPKAIQAMTLTQLKPVRQSKTRQIIEEGNTIHVYGPGFIAVLRRGA